MTNNRGERDFVPSASLGKDQGQSEARRYVAPPTVNELSTVICEARNAWFSGDIDDLIAIAVHRFITTRPRVSDEHSQSEDRESGLSAQHASAVGNAETPLPPPLFTEGEVEGALKALERMFDWAFENSDIQIGSPLYEDAKAALTTLSQQVKSLTAENAEQRIMIASLSKECERLEAHCVSLRKALEETYMLASAYGPEKSPPDELAILDRARSALSAQEGEGE
ncbi:hypothetical protein [Microvirga sp. G4-2]|uniref:hypothetical protein n=1 Tax=Microvirga sp. G4-2 TaxID=3434467 RepID=UPI0040440D78